MAAVAYTIGILDADPPYRNAMSRVMRAHGHVVHGYADATACLRAHREHRLDCLLVDLYLPDLGMFEIGSVLKRRLAGTPLIIVSTCEEPELAGISQAIGAAAFLRKPARAAAILDAIAGAIGGRAHRP
jgi:FixJ family two-component response regulator